MSKVTRSEIVRRRWWHKTSLISDLNKERLQQQFKQLCDSLVNKDYNSFLNKHICDDRLESGATKPLFKFIADRRGNNSTIKKPNGCNDSPVDFAKCFASAFCCLYG